MSLDIDLVEKWEGEVFSKNITHNLTKMANNVPIGNDTTLYDIMWNLEGKFPDCLKDYKERCCNNRVKLGRVNPYCLDKDNNN